MTGRVVRHIRSNAVGYLALLVALGGSAYAAGHNHQINGHKIRKGSLPGNRVKAGTLPGNRVKADTLTGKQVNESSLGEVPRAATAASATTATTAEEAKALGGVSRDGFGQGIVSGAIYDVKNGAGVFRPYGFSNPEDAYEYSAEAIAPVDMTVRDFVGAALANFNAANETVDFALYLEDPVTGITSVPLCQVSNGAPTCRIAGPIAIGQGVKYRIETVGANLPAPPSKIAVGFQYRAAAG
jgi:hypothetical protein